MLDMTDVFSIKLMLSAYRGLNSTTILKSNTNVIDKEECILNKVKERVVIAHLSKEKGKFK